MPARVVGLDIGSFGVRAVELTVGGNQPTLQRFAQVALPLGAVRDGEVHDPGAVSSAIRRLWAEGGFRAKRVVMGVANQRVIVRQAELPAMTEEDLRAALQFEAQELIPIPVEDAILDFQIIEESLGADGERRTRILLAAAQRDMVRSHLAAVEGAGLGAQSVDVVAFALVRALTLGVSGFEDDGRAEAIVCIGGGVTNVVVHEAGVPRFVRVLLVGGDDVTEAIARELDVDMDTAEDLKRRANTASPDQSVARAGQVVADRMAPLVEEIRGSLDYYTAQAQSAPVGRVLVTGGGSRLTGLMERLQSQLGGRVEPARPLANLAIGNVKLSQEELADYEPLLTVPIGLALGGEVQRGLRRISLLPAEVAAAREQRNQAVLVGGVVGGLTLLLLLAWAVRQGQVSTERRKAADAESEVRRLQRQVQLLQGSTTLAADVATRQTQIRSVLTNDVDWTGLFQNVSAVIPTDVWLTSFQGQATGGGGTVNFSAKGFDQTSTARWLQRVGDLKSLTGVWVPNSTKGGTGAATTVTFSSQANLTPGARRTDRADKIIRGEQ